MTRVCESCFEGGHGGCAAAADWEELNAGAADAMDFIASHVRCDCFSADENRHWDAYYATRGYDYEETPER